MRYVNPAAERMFCRAADELVAFVACFVPARRAARVDPVVALRSE